LNGCLVGFGAMEHNVPQLYAVVCRLCAVGKLRIAAVISWLRLVTTKLK